MIACFRAGVPATAVYLVSPFQIASTPAALMWSGVSKSSSPSPRLITERPAASRARTFAEISAVGEGRHTRNPGSQIRGDHENS